MEQSTLSRFIDGVWDVMKETGCSYAEAIVMLESISLALKGGRL